MSAGTQELTTLRAAVGRFEQREVIDTIKQTVCKGATDAQLRMFLEVCKATGLDPFLKEIWYVAEKGIIMAARDGYLRVANENPNFDGIETRVERDNNKTPIKAVCTVWRKDRNHPTICEAYFNEYNKQSPVWKQYPSAMISKVAEVLALKRSFAINGVVSEEEMGDTPPAPKVERGASVNVSSQPQISSPAEVVPMELVKVFERIEKDPSTFVNAAKLLEDALTDRLGSVEGLRAYDAIADEFYAKFPQGTKDVGELKAVLRRLHDAIEASPAKA